MSAQVVPLGRDNLGAVRRFAEKIWTRPRSDAYYRWRYEDPAAPVGYVALHDGECVAMEVAIRRPWRIGPELVDVCEVFDWYAAPEFRRSGVGVRVMQAFMKQPHPLMLLGGTEETRSLLPRLGWQRVATATRWVLVLGADRALDGIRRRVRIPDAAAPVARLAAHAVVRRPGLRPRPRNVPRGSRVIPVASVGEEMLALQRGTSLPGTWPVWTDALLRWLGAGFPGVGQLLPLYFAIGERLVGFSLVRIYESEPSCDAEIVELFALEPSLDLYTWMVAETCTRAAAFGPSLVATSTTSPEVEAALRRNHFLQSSSAPVHFRLPDGATLPEPIRIGSNSGDSALVPFVERWWDAG